MAKLGKWKQVHGRFSYDGTPYYECSACGESVHLHGVKYPKRKMICDVCGRINIYPYEQAYEEESTLWDERDEMDASFGGLMSAT